MSTRTRSFSNTSSERRGLESLVSGWGTDFWAVDDILNALTVPGTTLLFAGSDEDWEGLLLGREDGEDAELFYIFVNPKMRGQGLGRTLFHAWEKGLRATHVHLEVRPSRTPALALYQALGFQVVRRRKNYYGDGEDALIMSREKNP